MDFTPAVVIDIVLDKNSKYFSTVGGYNGIGTIYYKKVKGNSYGSSGFAKPYFSNIFNFPLKNELIYLFDLPNPDIQNNINIKSTYYLSPINGWNSNHHNAIPKLFVNNFSKLPESQKRDYRQTELGAVRDVKNDSAKTDLGNTFIEKTNIKPLIKFEGDVTIEGRWGNSIRFGSTIISGSQPLNNWSSGSISGDPVTIIRNGQSSNAGSIGFLPVIENPNTDPSSIWLTSTQKLNVFLPKTYPSYFNEKPISSDQYNKPQILIKSGRLVFNSNEDHILFSSNKSINLHAVSSINLETTNYVVLETSKVYLGSKDATEKVVLGNTLKTQLDTLIKALDIFANACKLVISTPAGSPLPTLVVAADTLKNTLQLIKTDDILSDDVFTT
jgi:hypothetical protein